MQPVTAERDVRHAEAKDELSKHVLHYTTKDGEEHAERCGVHHLVHAWCPQGHDKGVSVYIIVLTAGLTVVQPLAVSADMRGGTVGNNAGAVRQYLIASRIVAKIFAAMFEVVYPEEYKKYKAAFDAGVWYTEDPGPWIGRAVVYKLQVHIHHDMQDGGPTATFPMGWFERGYMEIPTLEARL